MAQCDGAAVDIEILAVEMQFSVAGQHLRRKCFVEFDEVEVGEFQPVLRFHFANCRDWADAHDFRVDTGRSSSHDPRQRLQIVFLHEVLAGEHNRCRAIRDAGRIAC